jgi:hypothetical protein
VDEEKDDDASFLIAAWIFWRPISMYTDLI